jgi:uncharacterized protein
MAHQPVIDGLEFARAGASLQGAWPIRDLARLRGALASLDGELAYELQGARDRSDRPALRLKLRGSLQLICQRCLGAMEYPVRLDSELVLAASQAQIDAEPLEIGGPDWVLAGKEMALRELIEDELLLAVPLAPRHAACAARGMTAAASRSPFESLRGLVRGRN